MVQFTGIDCSDDCTAHAAAIKGKGCDFVGRYYRHAGSQYAPLTYSEATELTKAGLFIVALWEWASDKIDNFSYHQGFDQGSSAYNQALKAHQPAGTPIYFAVDSDFSTNQIAGPVNDYFKGVAAAFAGMGSSSSSYKIGVYGSGLTCDWLLNHSAVECTWMAVSSGWVGHSTFRRWDINQGFEDLKIPGLTPGDKGNYDSDTANGTYGGFQVVF